MATKNIGPKGGVYDASTTKNTYVISAQPYGEIRWSIMNKGDGTFFLEWDQADVEINNTEKDGKCILEAGDSVLVPAGVLKFTGACDSGTAKLVIKMDG